MFSLTYKAGTLEVLNYTPVPLLDRLQQYCLEHSELFEEIPLTIRTSKLGCTLLCELESRSEATEKVDFLSLATR